MSAGSPSPLQLFRRSARIDPTGATTPATRRVSTIAWAGVATEEATQALDVAREFVDGAKRSSRNEEALNSQELGHRRHPLGGRVRAPATMAGAPRGT